MKRVYADAAWPTSWKESYSYDLEEVYDEITNPGYVYAYANRRRQVLRLVTQVLSPGARILDVAAAQGNFSIALAELGYRVTWNDLRGELADYVKLKQEKGQIDFAPGNILDIAFPEPFDAVLITEVIEHVAHPDRFLAKVSELVRPGGYIFMTTPNGAYVRNNLPKFSECSDPSVYEAVQFKPNSDGHIFLLYPEEVRTIAAGAALEIEEMTLFTNPLTNGHMKTSFLLSVFPHWLVERIEALSQYLPWALRRKLSITLAARLRKPVASVAMRAAA